MLPPRPCPLVILAFELARVTHPTITVQFGPSGPETTEIFSRLVLPPRQALFWGLDSSGNSHAVQPVALWILIGCSPRASFDRDPRFSSPFVSLVLCPSIRFGVLRLIVPTFFGTLEKEVQGTVHWGGLAEPRSGTYILESPFVFGFHAFSHPFTLPIETLPLPRSLSTRPCSPSRIHFGCWFPLPLAAPPSPLLIAFCLLKPIPSGRPLLITSIVLLFGVHAVWCGDITRLTPILREWYPCHRNPWIFCYAPVACGRPWGSAHCIEGRLLLPDG